MSTSSLATETVTAKNVKITADTTSDAGGSVIHFEPYGGQEGRLYVKDKLIDVALRVYQASNGAEPKYVSP